LPHGVENGKFKNDLPSRRETDVDVELGDTPKGEEYEFTVLDPVTTMAMRRRMGNA
jgi:hypothetical protein